MSLTLDRHIAGGYFLVKSVERREWMSADLMPERILSLSGCLCPSAQVYWAWSDDEARDFGVPEDSLPQTHQEDYDFDYPNVFLTLNAARHYSAGFLPEKDQLHLLGIGLPAALVDDFLQQKHQRVYDLNRQQWTTEVIGVSRAVAAGEALAAGGQALGYEVLSYEGSLGHSWLCSGLEREMHTLYSIRPNPHGLIDSLDEAMQVYEWIAEDEQQGHRAEPEAYYPWLLVEYPLE